VREKGAKRIRTCDVEVEIKSHLCSLVLMGRKDVPPFSTMFFRFLFIYFIFIIFYNNLIY